MCKVISVSNQKGGVGKTVTCVNLGIGLAREGYKVLMIDADPQGSLSISLGFDEPDKLEKSLATIMLKIINDEEFDMSEGILRHAEGVDLLPGNIELSGLEISLTGVISRETILREYVNRAREIYDYIIIDCKLWEKPKRHALTIPQQKALINYIEENPEHAGWYPIVTVLLGTGMRIGECLGLRWEDVDFDKKMISVNHSLSDRPMGKERKCERHIMELKTAAGTRVIPMIDEVVDAFLQKYQIQKCLGFCTDVIDGYKGFIFSTSHGTLYQAAAINQALHRIQESYNKEEAEKAKKERRDPVLLPEFSCHHLRHTFCTRFCENETNLKVIQEIMGHADIQTTMDIYAEATEEKKQEVVNSLQGKIILK